MSKRFKLRLSLPSFHLCCSDGTSFPKSPLPAATTYVFSPVNPKAFEIPYPNFPHPPPSSPVHPISNRHVAHKITSGHCQSPSKPFPHNAISQFTTKKMQILPPKLEEKTGRNSSKGTPTCVSNSSTTSDWFSSDVDEQSEETESLLQSFSLDSSNDFGYPLETTFESSVNGNRTKKKNLTVQKLKRVFNTCKGGEGTWTGTQASECKSLVKKSPIRQVLQGKVNESYAVVKRSDDPYVDFKSSMLEMILEKQMFEDKELEQLLQCFLSLNSRHHHLVIVQAFSEIWKELFNV